MKSSSRQSARLVRVVTILSFLCGIAVPISLGQVSFLQPLTFPTNGNPTVDADFNRDGKLDIATPGTLLLGNGDGTFKAPINLSVSGNLVATADFNNDGNPDLLIASTQSTVLNVLLGNGDGTFQTAKIENVGISFSDIIAVDVNGDGKPDVLGLVGAQIFVFLGNGDGTFKTGVPYSAGPYPYLMLTGDFNGDGKVDIATAYGYPGRIGVMLGNGDGTFQSPVISSVGATQPFDLATADINDDGKLDLIIADQSTNQTYTFLGKGDGTFQAGILAAPSVGSLAVADLNSDGKPDLILNTQLSFIAEILLGNGDGTFTYFRAYASQSGGDNRVDMLTADFNNDGKLDLVAGDTMLLGSGNATFNGQPVTIFPAASSAASGDFNVDGNQDLAVTSSDVNILLGDGAGSFTVAHTYTLSAPGTAIAAGDLNGDGKLDLAIITIDSSQNWSLTVMLGYGDGTFGPPTLYQQGLATNSFPVLMADLRGDQKPYVLTLQGDSLVVFPNNGDGTFGAPASYFAGSGANGVVVADFNSDGKLDAAVSSSAGIGILLGDGDGTFQGATFIAIAGNASGIVTGDFNNDGKADLIVNCCAGSPVFLGNGNGTFTTVSGNVASGVLGVADFNGDGNLDLMTGDCQFGGAQSSTWCVQLGNGDGTFRNPITIMYDSDVVNGFNVVADFNHDQKSDIAIDLSPSLNSSPGGVFMLLNTTPPTPGGTLTPSAVNFGSQAAGTDSAPVPVTLKNTGSGVLTVTNVAIGGTNAAEFKQTNNCTTVQPLGTCTINVTFAPAAPGKASATLKVTDNTVNGAQMAALSGAGTGPGATFSPSSVTFAPQSVGTSSAATPVNLTNMGTVTLTITSLKITGTNASEFSQTNDCAGSIAPGSSCAINVTFTPTATGDAGASLIVTDNASGSPQTVALSGEGTGLDLGLGSGGSSSATVAAGSTATYKLVIGGAGFAGQTSMTCTGAPTGASCTISPASLNVSASSESALTVNVTTTSRTEAALTPGRFRTAPWLWAVAIVGVVMLPGSGIRRRTATRYLRVLPLGLLLLICSCGGGNSGGSQTNANGTPAGNYMLTVTAKSSGTTQSMQLALTVQ